MSPPPNARHHRYRIRPELRLSTPAPDPSTPDTEGLGSPTAPRSPVVADPAAQTHTHLWLAITLPNVALDVFTRAADAARPVAVTDGEGSQCRVVACNAQAAQTGVRAGLGLNAAMALCASLLTVARSERREQAALEELAAWASQFSSEVCLAPPDELLLEVRGSLRLFGGYPALRRQVQDGLQALGFEAALAVAPTPLAAQWLARDGDARPVAALTHLGSRLAGLPLEVLRWPDKQVQLLTGMGIRSVGECMRLPRDGFARRLGIGRLRGLDQAAGRRPDPREPYRLPAQFEAVVELPAASDSLALINLAGERLLTRLAGYLRARDACVQQFVVQLLPLPVPRAESQPAVLDVEVSLVSAGRDLAHLVELLTERLSRTELVAPVIAVSLQASRVLDMAPVAEDLFEDLTSAPTPARWGRLVEQLRARLGVDRVFGLGLHAEHRPEQAWQAAEPDVGSRRDEVPGRRPRPLWLLPSPQLLEDDRGFPYWQGALELRRGPERIESGWWDGADVSRDYYIADSPVGSRLWIYRERRLTDGRRRWFLQGFFA